MASLLVLWLGLGALILLGLRPLFGGWGPPALILWPPYVLLGLALAAVALKASIRPGTPPTLRAFRPLLIFALGGGALFAVHPLLARFSDVATFRARLTRSLPVYEAMVANLPADSVSGRWQWGAGLRYLVDSGPPLRVAILQPGRAYDGVEVAVYDTARPDAGDRRYQGVGRPFSGSLRDCAAVRPTWYRCLLRPSP